MGRGVSTNHKSSNRIELSQLGQDLLNFSDLAWPHPLIHLHTQPPTHPPMGRGVSTNHKSSNRIELSQLGQDLLNFSDLAWPHPLIHLHTQPPTHPLMGGDVGGVSLQIIIFKQNWIISIRSRLIKF